MGKTPNNLKTKEDVRGKRVRNVCDEFAVRKAKYAELKELRQILKERKSLKEEKYKKERKRIQENKKRKEINEIKSGKYDIVIKTLIIRLKIQSN